MRKLLLILASAGVILISSFTLKEYQNNKAKGSDIQKFYLDDQFCSLMITNKEGYEIESFRFSKGSLIVLNGEQVSGKLYNPLSGITLKIQGNGKSDELFLLELDVNRNGNIQSFESEVELFSLVNGISLSTREDPDKYNAVFNLTAKKYN